MWTQQQLEAINSTVQKRLVSASAGAGKTAILVERIRTLIRQGAHIDRMLIVTFTNAAASEMRDRISESLQADGLADELLRMQNAQISTLHSFCIDLLRRHFEAAQIDPSFRVCDPAERAVLSNQAMDLALDELYENANEDFMALHKCYGPHTELADWALLVYAHIFSRENPWDWLQNAVDMYDGDLSPWLTELTEMSSVYLESMLNTAQNAQSHANMREQAYADVLGSDIDLINKLKNTLETKGVQALAVALQTADFSRAPTVRGADPDIKACVFAARERMKKNKKSLSEALIPLCANDITEDVRAMREPLSGLIRLVRAYHEHFMALKSDRGTVDFTDLEHMALKVLKTPETADFTSRRFDHIFVDEYQDVSRVQEAIINAVSNANTLFLVGDVKQSIYRFRLADPTLFLEKYNAFASSEYSDAARIELTSNFRSESNILMAVNAVFSKIMTPETAETGYSPLDSPNLDGSGPAIRVGILDEASWKSSVDESIKYEIVENAGSDNDEFESENESEEASDDPSLADLLSAEREAAVCVNYINSVMGSQFYDKKAGKYRPYTYHDIVILLRGVKGTAQLYADMLQNAGIPAYTDSTGFFDVLEVRVIVDLLRAVHNRRQDIPLLGALRIISGIGGRELAEIRLASNNAAIPFYEAMEYCANNLQNRLGDKLRGFFERMNELRDKAQSIPMGTLIWHIYDETGWYEHVGAWPNGTARKANLRALVSHAETFDSGQIGGLYEFIRYLTQLKTDGESGVTAVFTQNEQAVRIMSVHKSKGLEFPVVIIGGLGRKFNLSGKMIHDTLGLSPSFIDPKMHVKRRTVAQAAVKWRQKREFLAEEMRILYVALTRARERLMLICSVNDITKQAEAWAVPQTTDSVLFSKCFFDWIGPLFHSEFSRMSAGEIFLTKKDGASFELEVIGSQAMTKPQSVQGVEEALAFAAVDYPDWVGKRLSWQYPHAQPPLPMKLSVTDLIRYSDGKPEHTTPQLQRRPGFMTDERLTPVEYGLAAHAIMQLIDIERLRTLKADDLLRDIALQIRAICAENGKDEKTEYVAQIGAFYTSDMGTRILKSSRVLREQPFNLSIGSEELTEITGAYGGSTSRVLVQGIIDCLFFENDGWVLLDYKTDRQPDMTAETRHKKQILLYARAVESIFCQPVTECYICYLRDSRNIRVPISSSGFF